jgi:hypothetical protein
MSDENQEVLSELLKDFNKPSELSADTGRKNLFRHLLKKW